MSIVKIDLQLEEHILHTGNLVPLPPPCGLAPRLARFDPPLSISCGIGVVLRTRHFTKQVAKCLGRVRHHLVLRRHLLPHLLSLLVVQTLHHLGHERHQSDRYLVGGFGGVS